jgi:hypothetical protein
MVSAPPCLVFLWLLSAREDLSPFTRASKDHRNGAPLTHISSDAPLSLSMAAGDAVHFMIVLERLAPQRWGPTFDPAVHPGKLSPHFLNL